MSDSNFGCLELRNRVFRMEGIAKIDLSWKSMFVNFGMHFCRFWEASGAVFLNFLSLKTSLKTKRFLMKSQISHSGSGEGDPRVFGPSEDIKA